ncbi:MAG: LytTR family transcriptional regulator DNA-binding domain-containing protein [Clostridia bacterium]|jgi:DNA-binding LytR/AlgR family response regulator|nr:LytTR family transcriptional regulator DNA-binding domain-containing protein [Clostridia bacterium]
MYKILITGKEKVDRYIVSANLSSNSFVLLFSENVSVSEDICSHSHIDAFVFISHNEDSKVTGLIKKLRNSTIYKHSPIAVITDSNNNFLRYPLVFLITDIYSKYEYLNFRAIIDHDISVSTKGKQKRRIIIENNNFVSMIDISDILFIEADKHKSVVYSADDFYEIPFSLKNVSEHISDTPLFQCHRSYIVNTENISFINKNSSSWEISFSRTNKTVPVSRNKKHELTTFIRNKNYLDMHTLKC